ncbi:CHAP domain-containing protein [Nocardia sp. NPDC003482]
MSQTTEPNFDIGEFALPDHIEQNLRALNNAPDEQTRSALERTFSAELAPQVTEGDEPTAEDLAALAHTLETADSASPQIALARAAQHEVGYHETGDNHTKYGRWYGADGVPWCDIFVSWCFNHTHHLKAIGGKFAYVPTHYDWFRKHGRLHRNPHDARRGDLIFYNFSGDRGVDHIGILVSSDGSSNAISVEGNYGNAVRRRTLTSRTPIVAYGRPAW